MRVDREGFLLAAISLFAACERADSIDVEPVPVPAPAVVVAPRPASTAPALALRPVAPVEDVKSPAPTPKPVRPRSAAKRWFFALSTSQRSNVTALCKHRSDNPCAGFFARMEHEDGDVLPDPEARYLAALSVPQRQQVTAYCEEGRKMPAPTCETPLVVAFEDQPVEFVTATSESFAFVPGTPMVTDWPTAATPWIARDLDGDGNITSGAELFGSSTMLDGGTARNGFEALVPLDANNDGTLDARDPAFAELVLWADRNGDHHSTRDELRPLASVIISIPLAHTLDPRCNARDACEGERGKLRWRDATGAERQGAVVDIYVPRRR